MAITQPKAGAPTRLVVGSTMFTLASTGATTARPTQNNRSKTSKGTARKSSSKGSGTTKAVDGNGKPTGSGSGPSSVGFTNLDRSIIDLDMIFSGLPNKADWNAYALNILGSWQLCANCDVELSGKKLFRQINLNRQTMGLTIETAPIDPTEFSQVDVFQLNLITDTGTGITSAWARNDSTIEDAWVQASLGLSLLNPFGQILAADWNNYVTSGTTWDTVFAIVSSAVAFPAPGTTNILVPTTCHWTNDGAPGNVRPTRVAWEST